MGKKSRTKGKVGEREARDEVRRLWKAPRCIRAAQANGAFSADLLHALPETHVEVKRYKRIVALDFLEQALEDAEPGELPVVIMREDRGSWVCMMRLEDSPRFCALLTEQLNMGGI